MILLVVLIGITVLASVGSGLILQRFSPLSSWVLCSMVPSLLAGSLIEVFFLGNWGAAASFIFGIVSTKLWVQRFTPKISLAEVDSRKESI